MSGRRKLLRRGLWLAALLHVATFSACWQSNQLAGRCEKGAPANDPCGDISPSAL